MSGVERPVGDDPTPGDRPAKNHPTPDSAQIALHRSELEDLDARIEARAGDFQRHVLWIALGVSPGALIPMIATLSEFGASAVVAVVLIVLMVEGWRAWEARRDLRRLRILRVEVEERLEAAEVGRPSPETELDTVARTPLDGFHGDPEETTKIEDSPDPR